jgi:hypothetical protein
VTGFVVARVLANTFWVWTTNLAFNSLGELFTSALTGPAGIALQVAGLASIVLLFKVPWARWLRRAAGGDDPPDAKHGTTPQG